MIKANSKESKNSKKSIIGWCLFDFANSSYSAVIVAVVFPVYYVKIVVGNETGLGDLWWGRAISLSMAVVALTSPFLGGIADYAGSRKRFLMVYTLGCVLSVAALSIVEPGMVLTGFVLMVLANIGMEGGLVFYNAYLPDIAPKSYFGRISAWGFALGYVGSIISLVAALPLVRAGMYRGIWVMVAAFFLVFSMPLFAWCQHSVSRSMGVYDAAVTGLKETAGTIREIWKNKSQRRFLLAFFIYQDGVNTVIVFSSIFASVTLGFEPGELVLLYMVVQVTALIGSTMMAVPIDLWGARSVIALSLCLWISVTVIAYFTETKTVFWAVATIAGMGLGTIQAASRALYAGFIPQGKAAGYFGVYSLVGKTSAVLGPLVFGLVSSWSGSQRPAILSVALFFIVGGALLAGSTGETGIETPIKEV